jgi:hypothetical protein
MHRGCMRRSHKWRRLAHTTAHGFKDKFSYFARIMA